MADEYPVRIVCIEMIPKTIELVKLILRREGFEVIGVINGRDGLTAIAQTQPSLSAGFDDARYGRLGSLPAMRADEHMKRIPVIVLAAKAQSIDRC